MTVEKVEKSSVEDLIGDFSLFETWEEKYAYLIDIGKKIPRMDEALKADSRLVRGCQSRVWMLPEFVRDEGGDVRFFFQADSEAQIVRGLIAVLSACYEGETPDRIGRIDVEDVFRRIGLETHLSPNRRNGFFAMVETIRRLAQEYA